MTVLIVRPEPECSALVSMLAQSGIKAVALPLLEFGPGADLDKLADTLDGLAPASKVIAVSPRAASFACQHLATTGRRWRDDLVYLAVGTSTARQWQQASGLDVLVPATADSEGLLALPALHAVDNQQVLILRGESGRELLNRQLQKRGADVRYFETYQRHWRSAGLSSRISQWKADGVDTLIVTSGGQLARFHAGFSDKDQQWLYRCHILVPSKRIYNQAIALGFTTLTNVDSAANAQLFSAVCNICNSGHSDDREQKKHRL